MSVSKRIRVLKDNGRDGIVGLEGTIRMLSPSGYVVVLDNDPALGRNMYNPGGIARTPADHHVFRFFYPYEVELLPD
jgi:hypothetical protein